MEFNKNMTRYITGSTLMVFCFIISMSIPNTACNSHLVALINEKSQLDSTIGYAYGGRLVFFVDTIEYRAVIPGLAYFGEKYWVYYKKEDPNVNVVDASRPVFDRNEDTETTKGIVWKINRTFHRPFGYVLIFRYTVDGKTIHKNQRLSDTLISKEYLPFQKGDSIDVMYWQKDPRRAIALIFDSIEQVKFDIFPFVTIDRTASFPGGTDSLHAHIDRLITIPKGLEKERVELTTYVQFIVGPDGRVVYALLLNSVHPVLDSIALQAFTSLPPFKPAIYQRRPIHTEMTLPITFVLSGDSDDE